MGYVIDAGEDDRKHAHRKRVRVSFPVQCEDARQRAERRERLGEVKLAIDAGGRSGRLVAELEGVGKRFGAREIVRDHGVMMLLGSMRAEERLAAFLLNLSKRFTKRGFSRSDFHLRMTREEIGSYLGLKLETVSRLFSKFQEDGLIEVQQKHVRILDIEGLEALLSSSAN